MNIFSFDAHLKAVRFGEQKINLHVEVEARFGSLSLRDPDENLIEVSNLL